MSYELATVNGDTGVVEGDEGKNEVLQFSLFIKKEDWDAAVANAANSEALIQWINTQLSL